MVKLVSDRFVISELGLCLLDINIFLSRFIIFCLHLIRNNYNRLQSFFRDKHPVKQTHENELSANENKF